MTTQAENDREVGKALMDHQPDLFKSLTYNVTRLDHIRNNDSRIARIAGERLRARNPKQYNAILYMEDVK